MSRRKFIKHLTGAAAIAPLTSYGFMGERPMPLPRWKPSGPINEQQQLENATRMMRAKLMADHLRPTFHFVSPEGHDYPFDPNGAIFWKGQYHLGYIYQHNDEHGERKHWWGHVASHDLFHWHALPPMLPLHPSDPEQGIFSGGAFISKEGVPHVVYHGVDIGNCLARAVDDDLVGWQKFEENPILPLERRKSLTEYDEDNAGNAWDPHIWLEGEVYYQISGGNPPGLFKSTDLVKWQYVGQFMDQQLVKHQPFEDWSCPDLFKLRGKYVTVAISHNLGAQYYLGDFVDEQFIPQQHGRMNWPGGTFFAPESLVDDQGRRILFGWVLETRPYDDVQGWSGVMSLPRVLDISRSGELTISPPEEVRSLRYNTQNVADFELRGGEIRHFPELKGNVIEIHVTFDSLDQPGDFGLKVLAAPDDSEFTEIRYERSRQELVIDFERSNRSGNVQFPSYCMMGHLDKTQPEFVTAQRVPFTLEAGEPLSLEIYIDKSILEVFANRKTCVTQRVYPSSPASVQTHVFSRQAPVRVSNLRCWQLAQTNFC